jgi:hypothetical protein
MPGLGAHYHIFLLSLYLIDLWYLMSLLLFCLIKKVTKKIKAVFKSYDFLTSSGARKKLAPPASGLKQFFALSPSDAKKSGFE